MRPRTEIYSIDANIILRFLVGDSPRLYQKAFKMFGDIESGRTAVTCDPVNLAEVVWVMKSVYALTNDEAGRLLRPVIEMEGFHVPNKERYILALDLYADGMKSFGDACACAAALLECDGRLYSFDEKLSKVPGIVRSEGP